MSSTKLLTNDTLWQELSDRVKKSKRVDAAIAYFGTGGADLLKLRAGHRLVVDMSPRVVKAGGTNPHEIERLLDRGVEVFSRQNLHAKVIVFDRAMISSSANVSQHSRSHLDEAGLLTFDPIAIRRGRDFVGRLCLEPVGPEYLAYCKEVHRPPKFATGPVTRAEGNGRLEHPKLWIVNLKELSLPDTELKQIEAGEQQATNRIKDKKRFAVESFTWSSKPKLADQLERDVFVIQIITSKDKSIEVRPPGRYDSQRNYMRDRESKKRRWVFYLEVEKKDSLSWPKLRQSLNRILAKVYTSPRTFPVVDPDAVHEILSLWK